MIGIVNDIYGMCRFRPYLFHKNSYLCNCSQYDKYICVLTKFNKVSSFYKLLIDPTYIPSKFSHKYNSR